MCKTTILHAKKCYANILLSSICPEFISKLFLYTKQTIPWNMPSEEKKEGTKYLKLMVINVW